MNLWHFKGINLLVIRLSVLAVYLLYASFALADMRLANDILMTIESGDSFYRLFGEEWERVADINQEIIPTDYSGSKMPDQLSEGSLIIVPAGVLLTDYAMQKNEVRAVLRGIVLKDIEHAEDLAKVDCSTSEVGKRGLELLRRARMIFSQSDGPLDLAECRRIAAEAAICLAMAQEIAKETAARQTLTAEITERSKAISALQTSLAEQEIHGRKLRLITIIGVSCATFACTVLLFVCWLISRQQAKEAGRVWIQSRKQKMQSLALAITKQHNT
ncbi:MAG: hypothetical protein A2511_09070 [Deltaproteobacteria bacterium RIFOXYD12_FULL_50_9]|nr:MAG: hypothetical protein A2511_09070 [Deltaproteobacteria bacterium RIFOXYD12_FULL_50_9]